MDLIRAKKLVEQAALLQARRQHLAKTPDAQMELSDLHIQ